MSRSSSAEEIACSFLLISSSCKQYCCYCQLLRLQAADAPPPLLISSGLSVTDKLVEKIVKHDSWPIQPDILSQPLLTFSNPVPWQNWMAAYLGYTLRMKTLFRGWPVTAHERRRRLLQRHHANEILLTQQKKNPLNHLYGRPNYKTCLENHCLVSWHTDTHHS